jgi:hypothetical protein
MPAIAPARQTVDHPYSIFLQVAQAHRVLWISQGTNERISGLHGLARDLLPVAV